MTCAFCGSSMAFKDWQVSKDESGIKLVQFLQRKLGASYSLRALKRAIESNACTINGRVEHFASAVLGYGDHVRLHLQPEAAAKAQSPQHVPIGILYEDEDFLLIDKPAGISSEDPSLLQRMKMAGQRENLALAHRLDKETSGVLALTKSERAKQALYQLFKQRKIAKVYYAIVDGEPASLAGRIENYLGKIAAYHGQTLWGVVDSQKGLIAITEWKLMRKGRGIALIKCLPLTGRTHQIRVHLAGLGMPILGDKQYGRQMRSPFHPKRCLLHAASLEFIHPFTGQKVKIESPWPADFNEYSFLK